MGERFLRDLHTFWREEGMEVIRHAARTQPASFIRSLTILLRPTVRDSDSDDQTGEFDDFETPEEIIEAARLKLGKDAADALATLFTEPPKLVRANSKRARKATRARARSDNRE